MVTQVSCCTASTLSQRFSTLETSGLTDHQMQPLVSAHNACLLRVTGMGRRQDGTLHPKAQMYVAAGLPKLMYILNTARPMCLGQVDRMPDESVSKQLLLAEVVVGIGGVVGGLLSKCCDGAFAAVLA
eukprot:363429-Chlamydomonas_euryale.AAC.17